MGVTSIVIGLTVQTAVGPVIAGLLLLFAQPFRIGDWLDTTSGGGRFHYSQLGRHDRVVEDGGRELSLGRLGVGRLHRHDRPNPQRMLTGELALTETPRSCPSLETR